MKPNEEKHIQEMLEIKKQIYLTDSWKRRNDLEKHLKKLENDWFKYKKLTKGNK